MTQNDFSPIFLSLDRNERPKKKPPLLQISLDPAKAHGAEYGGTPKAEIVFQLHGHLAPYAEGHETQKRGDRSPSAGKGDGAGEPWTANLHSAGGSRRLRSMNINHFYPTPVVCGPRGIINI